MWVLLSVEYPLGLEYLLVVLLLSVLDCWNNGGCILDPYHVLLMEYKMFQTLEFLAYTFLEEVLSLYYSVSSYRHNNPVYGNQYFQLFFLVQ